jgi:hypothetical protein
MLIHLSRLNPVQDVSFSSIQSINIIREHAEQTTTCGNRIVSNAGIWKLRIIIGGVVTRASDNAHSKV